MNIYFGKNLKKLRRERNLTQEKLADFLGVSFQTISKWERGDTYPDITMLPVISNLFKVSVDELIGINREENEKKINEYIKLFDSEYFTDTDKLMNEFEKAVSEFPSDFNILVRYMELLTEIKDHPFIKASNKGNIYNNTNSNNPYEVGFIKNPEYEVITQKLQSIYDVIQNQCTDDDIRIRSKRIMIKHLMIRYHLSFDQETGKWRCDTDALEKAREILNSLPALSDTREYLAIEVNDDLSSRNDILEETLEELLFLFQERMRNYIYYDESISNEYKTEKIKSINSLLDILEKDDRISKNEIYLMLNYGQLSYMYSQMGNYNEAVYYLKKCLATAKKLDNNPTETESIARFYNLERPLAYGSMCRRMKAIITENYPFTDEFKNSTEFKCIVESIK